MSNYKLDEVKELDLQGKITFETQYKDLIKRQDTILTPDESISLFIPRLPGADLVEISEVELNTSVGMVNLTVYERLNSLILSTAFETSLFNEETVLDAVKEGYTLYRGTEPIFLGDLPGIAVQDEEFKSKVFALDLRDNKPLIEYSASITLYETLTRDKRPDKRVKIVVDIKYNKPTGIEYILSK